MRICENGKYRDATIEEQEEIEETERELAELLTESDYISALAAMGVK